MTRYIADHGYVMGFEEDSTIEAWWIELELGHVDHSGLTTDFITEHTLSLSDVEAVQLANELHRMVAFGREKTAFDWQPVPVPEKDKALLLKMLAGIAATWDHPADVPDWRTNEYLRGQLELVIETCRVVTDAEFEEGTGDIDGQRDRIVHWIQREVWK